MRKKVGFRLMLSGFLLLSGCSYIPFIGGDPEEPVKEEGVKMQASSITPANKSPMANLAPSRLEKSLAQIQAQLNEIQRQNKSYSERIKVLEQSMTLGIVPTKLMKQFEEQSATSMQMHQEDSSGEQMPKSTEEKGSDIDRLKDMAKGRELFTNAEYGKALVVFEKVAEKAPSSFAEHHFWLGRSWYELSNLDKAMESLRDYLSHPHPVKQRQEAIYHLARTELKFGLNEKGIQRLEALVRENPSGRVADAARMVLSSYESAL